MSAFSYYRVANDIQTPILEGQPDVETGHYLENLEKRLRVDIISLTEDEIVFDLIGVETPIANALRRIMLAEVAIELKCVPKSTLNHSHNFSQGSDCCY